MTARDPLSLAVYRGATGLLTPLAHGLLMARRARGKEHPERMGERTGRPGLARPEGPLIWMHGASVGELNSLLPIVAHYRAHGYEVLVTTGTVTSAEVASRTLAAGAIHQFVPLDTPGFVDRFLRHWRPDIGLIAESEIWPNLIVAARGAGTHLALLNARMSERSFRRWQRMPRLIGALLGRFEICLAQSAPDAARLTALGAPRVASVGNLKYDVPAPEAAAPALAALGAAIAGRPVLLAASTHEGEEAIVAEAHRIAANAVPGLLTIIAPRHPPRGPAIETLLQAYGLRVLRRRSAGAGALLPAPDTDIYVADTIGEMGILYRLAPAAFIGRSLGASGGQNPIEPAKLGAAILHGPAVRNFADVYQALGAAGGAITVRDAPAFARTAVRLLIEPSHREAVTTAARQTVEASSGAIARTLAELEPLLASAHLGRA
jgi:3-deoxy-D-manno-octulosonic-acid transferase